MSLLFPNASEGATILQISSISILFIVLSQTINGALQGLGKVAVPAIGLAIGVIAKFVLNIILIPIPEIGINGAAIASTTCHIISCVVGFFALQKYIKLDLKPVKCILKPALATIMMIASSYFVYINLEAMISQRLATLLSMIFAVGIYLILIILLKIFSKNEIKTLPLGEKIYQFLERIKIYE